MTFAFIRHGQTDWNLRGLLQGSSDIPLNATGREQAHDAITVLRDTGVAWSAIVSSPLARARVTAEIIAEGLGIELGPSYDDLMERDYGTLEGTDDASADKSDPTVEPLDSVVERGRRALDQIASDYGDEADVIVVCHGTIIRYTLAALAGREIDAIHNGTTATFARADDGWQVLTVNDSPLEALAQPPE